MALLTAAQLTASAKRNGVPEHLIEGLVRFVTLGYRPGHFLTAVLENDLMEAMRRADIQSQAALFALCVVIDNDIPALCHGSSKCVSAWIEAGGMRQFDREKAGA